MPSFASLTAFASLAFAAIGAALPHSLPTENQALAGNTNPLTTILAGLGPSTASKRDLDLIELEILTAIANTFGVKLDDLVKIISNTVGVANNANIEALNAVSHQARDDVAEVDAITTLLTTLGINAKDLVGVFGNVVGVANNLNVDAANAKSIQSRELLELEALTKIANFIGVDIKDVLKVVGNVVGVANNLNVEAANAKSIQSRELAELDILTAIANTFGVKLEDLVKVVANTVGIANNANIDALNAVSHQARDDLLDVEAVTTILTTLGIDAKNLVGIFGNVAGVANNANVDAANAKSVQSRDLIDAKVITAIATFIGVDAKDVVKVINNVVGVANNLNIEAANAKSIQSRDSELVPFHTDIVTVIATYLGIDVSEVLNIIHNKVSVLDNLNLEVANAKSVQSRDANVRLSHLLPIDISIITKIANLFNVDVDELLTIADNHISILPNANIELLNAKAVQHTSRETGLESVPLVGALAAAVTAVKPRGEPRSFPHLIVDVTAEIQPLCDHIRHLIDLDLDASATIDLAIPILKQIKTVLLGVKVELEFLVAHPIEGVLVLKGKVLSVRAVAELLATLLTTVVVALGLVAKVAASVRIEVVLGLVAEIGVALGFIVGCALQLVGGLLVELTPLVECIAHIIVHLNLGALIQVLKLTAKAA